MTEHARERAPQARMRMLVVWQAVGADHGVLIREDRSHIILVELKIDGASRHQPLGSFHVAARPFGGDVVQHLARVLRKVGGPRHHDLHAGFCTAGIEALGTRIVGIRIKANRLRLPGGVDDGEGLRRLPEIVAARALMMRDGQRDRSLPPDYQRLVNRFFQFFEVIAMMGTIKPTMRLDGLHQGQNLLGGSSNGTRIVKTGAEADCTLIHRRLYLAPHFRDFGGSRGAVEPVHDAVPQRDVPLMSMLTPWVDDWQPNAGRCRAGGRPKLYPAPARSRRIAQKPPRAPACPRGGNAPPQSSCAVSRNPVCRVRRSCP